MAQLGQVNANEIPERQSFDALPVGHYRVMITASEMKDTKDGKGSYLQLEMDVQAGEHQGRKLFERLNLNNQNQQTVDIAYRTLGEICRAVGKLQITDSVELHNTAFEAEVEVEPGKPYVKDGVQKEGQPQNRVRKYSAIGAVQATQSAMSSKPSGTAAAGGQQKAATPPWKK